MTRTRSFILCTLKLMRMGSKGLVECASCDLLLELLDLIAPYYVFDTKYPDAGKLIFIQGIGLQLKDKQFRGTKYAFLQQSAEKCKDK